MANALPPPPGGNISDSWVWNEWFRIVWTKLNQVISSVVVWSSINFTGSNITDIATRNHNNLQNIQGGTSNEYYHLTNTAYTALGSTTTLATNATTGFLCIPSCAGTPTGTPTLPYTGAVPLVADSTNNKVYAYISSAWRVLN